MTCTEMSDISHPLFSAVQASVGSRMQTVGAVAALLGKEQVLPAVREEELELSCRMQDAVPQPFPPLMRVRWAPSVLDAT